MAQTSTEAPPAVTRISKRRRFTVEEYRRAGELGLFGPEERLELVDGEVIRKLSPQKEPHAIGTSLVLQALQRVFGAGYHVRCQLPMSLGAEDEPEPDICVVVGNPRDYRASHPITAVLVAEVSDTSLAYDRHEKASLYARAGIADYWIVNLVDAVVEVHRDPAPMADQPFGHHYRSVTRHAPPAVIAPLAAPQAQVPVVDLLP